jgi:hypothetical protein
VRSERVRLADLLADASVSKERLPCLSARWRAAAVARSHRAAWVHAVASVADGEAALVVPVLHGPHR